MKWSILMNAIYHLENELINVLRTAFTGADPKSVIRY